MADGDQANGSKDKLRKPAGLTDTFRNYRLIKYLKPYKREIAIIVGLQLIGTLAALTLPSLNADIIDNGVLRGDTGYIIRMGGWMLAVSLVQVVVTIAAVYFGARSAMAFGRDVR